MHMEGSPMVGSVAFEIYRKRRCGFQTRYRRPIISFYIYSVHKHTHAAGVVIIFSCSETWDNGYVDKSMFAPEVERPLPEFALCYVMCELVGLLNERLHENGTNGRNSVKNCDGRSRWNLRQKYGGSKGGHTGVACRCSIWCNQNWVQTVTVLFTLKRV